jgi:DNA-binding ferritin-like protein
MSCPNFIAECFALRTATHQLHLSSKSYAEHQALGEFYEALTDLTDKYAEVYMGLNKSIAKFPSYPTPTGSPVELLEEFLDDIQEEFDEDDSKQSLLNILAEIEELTARTLYKLRNLK